MMLWQRVFWFVLEIIEMKVSCDCLTNDHILAAAQQCVVH